MPEKTSTKFYDLTAPERIDEIAAAAGLTAAEKDALTAGLSLEQADHMIENVVGIYSLPLGIARNFLVNGRPVLVPMVIEEPSVVAGASFMARLAPPAAGLPPRHQTPEMIGQMQVLDLETWRQPARPCWPSARALLEEAACCRPRLW